MALGERILVEAQKQLTSRPTRWVMGIPCLNLTGEAASEVSLSSNLRVRRRARSPATRGPKIISWMKAWRCHWRDDSSRRQTPYLIWGSVQISRQGGTSVVGELSPIIIEVLSEMDGEMGMEMREHGSTDKESRWTAPAGS
ncbi:hypothetical protein VTN00DRAFT_9447 [Thermoascus crustaceus]|uniref:uncharacterized protein n=1 Tax=Thermoascus crustaceus TaxID=5088 RepID=UPI003744625A